MVARAQGWGFPTSNTVTEDAKDGALKGAWADVVPKERLAEVKGKLELVTEENLRLRTQTDIVTAIRRAA